MISLQQGLLGDIDIDVEVDVDIDLYFGCLKVAPMSVQVLLTGFSATNGTDFENSEIASPVQAHPPQTQSVHVGMWYMGGCQNYGPFWGLLIVRHLVFWGTQRGTIILTTTHIPAPFLGLSMLPLFQSLEASQVLSTAKPQAPKPTTQCPQAQLITALTLPDSDTQLTLHWPQDLPYC